MECVNGDDLSALIEGDSFDDGRIRPLLLQLVDAADALLKRGWCHRDIKPENIRIRPNGDLVLLDLGVLRPLDGSELTEGDNGLRFLGTTRYTPRELLYMKEEPPREMWEAITVYQIGTVSLRDDPRNEDLRDL